MLGLDGAGKTTILYKLKKGEVTETFPTIGFNVENVIYNDVNFNIWEVGGQDKIRPLWPRYFTGVQGLIFVVDSSDRERIREARNELMGLLQVEELQDAALLIFANKQDIPTAMIAPEIADQLRLNPSNPGLKRRDWHIQTAIGTTGAGLYEGLDWLERTILGKQPHRDLLAATT